MTGANVAAGPFPGMRAVERELARITGDLAGGPVVRAAEQVAAGAYRDAVATLGTPAGTGLLGRAWRRLAVESAWVALPDGSTRVPFADPPAGRAAALDDLARAMAAFRGDDRIALLAGLVGSDVPDLRGLHALLPPTGFAAPPRDADLTLAACVRTRLLAASLSWRLASRFHLLEATVLAALGREREAQQVLVEVEAAAVAAGDQELRADCETARGDRLLAPLSSPAAWNTALQVWPGVDGVQPAEWERREATFAERPADVEAAYARAAALLVDTTGAVAQLEARRAILEASTGRLPDAIARSAERTAALRQAGDQLGAWVAATHGVLFDLVAGRLGTDVDPAVDAVRWALSSSGPGPAYGIAQIVGRVGRRLLRHGVAYEGAVAICGLAEHLFTLCGAPVSADQARIDRVGALTTVGGYTRARLLLDEVLDRPVTRTGGGPVGAESVHTVLMLLRRRYDLCDAVRDVTAMGETCDRFHAEVDAATANGVQLGEAAHLLPVREEDVLATIRSAMAARDTARPDRAAELFDAAARRLAGLDPGPGAALAVVLAAARGDWTNAAERARELAARTTDIVDGGDRAGVEARRLRLLGSLSLTLVARDNDGVADQVVALRQCGEPWGGDTLAPWQARMIEGLVLENDGELVDAVRAFDQAALWLENSRRSLRRDSAKIDLNNLDHVTSLYRRAAAAAARLWQAARLDGRADRGRQASRYLIAFQELGRARALADLVSADPVGTGSVAAADADDTARRWRFVDAQAAEAAGRLVMARSEGAPATRIQDLRARSNEADAALHHVEMEMHRADPTVWDRLDEPVPPALPDDLAAALAPGTVVVQYTIDGPDLVASAFTCDGVVAARQATDADRVGALSAELAHACARQESWETGARELGARLLDPMGDAIGPARRVVVVPSGPTMRIPWGLLFWDGAMLMEHRTVATLPMARLLLERPRPQRNSGLPVVLGDPARTAAADPVTGAPLVLPSIRWSGVEARCVASRLSSGVVLVGPDATEAALRHRLPGAPVVHLATHGLLDRAAPLASSVLLADGQSMTAAELAGMRLDAGLVVLSACTSGVGPVAGDEMLGLGRGLLAAGVRATVLTLWAIDDLSSAMLMDRFHQLRAGTDDDAEALRLAQLWLRDLSDDEVGHQHDAMIERLGPGSREATAVRSAGRGAGDAPARRATWYGHPYHWAGFTYTGS